MAVRRASTRASTASALARFAALILVLGTGVAAAGATPSAPMPTCTEALNGTLAVSVVIKGRFSAATGVYFFFPALNPPGSCTSMNMVQAGGGASQRFELQRSSRRDYWLLSTGGNHM
jgi:hypothetical protein